MISAATGTKLLRRGSFVWAIRWATRPGRTTCYRRVIRLGAAAAARLPPHNEVGGDAELPVLRIMIVVERAGIAVVIVAQFRPNPDSSLGTRVGIGQLEGHASRS